MTDTGAQAAPDLNNGRPAIWSAMAAPGGMVCAVPDPSRPYDICGMPVESEPCDRHGEGSRPATATPGQAFRATLIDRWSARGRCVDGRSWDQLPKEDRDDLEAAADAALIVAIPGVATRLAEATEENTRLMLTFDSHVRETGKIVGERGQLAAKLARALAANQRWAETLADVQQRHAEVKAERNRIAESCATTAAELSACKQNNAAIAVQLDQYRDQRDEAREQLATTRAIARMLQALVAEILAEVAEWTIVVDDQATITEWRKRAELEARGGSGDGALRPRVACLCGSTRFYDQFQQANYDLTMKGEIVLSVGFYPHAKAEHGHGEGVGHDSAEKTALDELHKRKIDLADYVLVLNVGGYVGESTRSEIGYALAHGKPVHYLEARDGG